MKVGAKNAPFDWALVLTLKLHVLIYNDDIIT